MSTVPLEEYLRVSDELEALRDVVGSVRALADEWERREKAVESDPDADVGMTFAAASAYLRAALAPVPSGRCGEGGPEY
jgi:hypothetical protein